MARQRLPHLPSACASIFSMLRVMATFCDMLSGTWMSCRVPARYQNVKLTLMASNVTIWWNQNIGM